MKIERFQMERTQCLYENEVDFNLSESGVSPLSIGELVPGKEEREKLDALPLGYPHSTGRESLRANDLRNMGQISKSRLHRTLQSDRCIG